ncbi:molybdenum cofactor guanylyltransferase [Bacillus glycinifermentans]|uniref:Probable molybdenum cofactor guanylyltransferase n=1 Tax=Bacillus glycinifermentans TaxID=1664069 RepID=A0A0T6BQK9_9BACI|nr:molybdenum cofactor guanylyltransferase [Bacillus glycinifermentans]ATH91239.1 molybdenum cofactor guanylyltransferase [Bacillus glycinifermentans]KRT93478.1 molybdopterin-guanine dinucleotide biosynthesis protein A [Bacillus glycinifermentans]MEC0485462.1 molybdenum cofactor guanylyltransferase [Bacillus glycinifermentans]MEC3606900.1 molybdenum cofactor guanylyltransferase [Bacillus glycinifermentans]
MKPVHVILAGGLSSRFGEPKAFALWKNKPLYQWCKQALGGEALILSRPELTGRFKASGETAVLEDAEPFKGKGPLAGIYTAMSCEEGDIYTVLACDTPLIRKETVAALKQLIGTGADAVVPVAGGRAQPLAAVYHKRVKQTIYEQLCRDQLKISDFLSQICVEYVEAGEIGAKKDEFTNVNKKSDLERIEPFRFE